jgi:hypothetical protein
MDGADYKQGRRYFIGCYATAEKGHAAYVANARELFGEICPHGVGGQWLESVGVPYYIRMGAEAVAVLLFALDILSLAGFVIAETLKLLRLIWDYFWQKEALHERSRLHRPD